MIRHIVLINFRDDVSEEHKLEIYAELRALVGQIDGLDGAQFRYLADPRHQAAGRKLVAACEGGLEGVLPFDMEL